MKDDAPLRQAIDATLDDMLFQLEARDAIGQQAAHTVVPVVDMHFISRLAQIFRRGETCGTSADDANGLPAIRAGHERSEEHTSELQSLMRISYAVFCLKKKKNIHTT